MYECENYDKPQIDSQLNLYEFAMLNDFEIYNVPTESAEIEKWSILNTKLTVLNKMEKNCFQIE